jgi:hypothetical protein
MIDSYPTFQEPVEGSFYTINRLAEPRFPGIEAIIGGNTYCTDKPLFLSGGEHLRQARQWVYKG